MLRALTSSRYIHFRGHHSALLARNRYTAHACLRTCVFLFLPVVLSFSFFSRRMRGGKRGEIERAMRNVQRAFTPLSASGCTCIAAGDSPRSSIINVHRVSQVEAPKSIYPAAFRAREGQVHRKRNRVRSFVRSLACVALSRVCTCCVHTSVYQYDQ